MGQLFYFLFACTDFLFRGQRLLIQELEREREREKEREKLNRREIKQERERRETKRQLLHPEMRGEERKRDEMRWMINKRKEDNIKNRNMGGGGKKECTIPKQTWWTDRQDKTDRQTDTQYAMPLTNAWQCIRHSQQQKYSTKTTKGAGRGNERQKTHASMQYFKKKKGRSHCTQNAGPPHDLVRNCSSLVLTFVCCVLVFWCWLCFGGLVLVVLLCFCVASDAYMPRQWSQHHRCPSPSSLPSPYLVTTTTITTTRPRVLQDTNLRAVSIFCRNIWQYRLTD
jgi:hypothetical protein